MPRSHNLVEPFLERKPLERKVLFPSFSYKKKLQEIALALKARPFLGIPVQK